MAGILEAATRDIPRFSGFHSLPTAQRTIRGFEAMLWLRKGFGFAGPCIVRDENRLLPIQLRTSRGR